MTKQLTEKQQKFVQAKAMGLGNTDAGLAAGYARAGVDVAASKLMKLPHIQAAIKAAKKSMGKGERAAAKEREEEREPGRMKDRYDSPLDLMLDVMNNPQMPVGLRFESAKQAMPYCHARVGDGGKKQKKQDRATELSTTGTRKPKAPPQSRLLQ